MRFEWREQRRSLWLSLAAGLGAAVFFSSPALRGQARVDAARLHGEAFVLDAHLHSVNRQFYQGGSMGERLEGGHFDLARAKEGGLDAFFMTIYVTEEYYAGRHETRQMLRLLDEARRQLELNRDKVELALEPSDLARIQKSGTIAAILDVEGGFDLDGDLGVLRTMQRLGVRSFQLPAHNHANYFADSCCAKARYGGLNEQGRKVIAEANRLGMMINVAHGSQETIQQTVEASRHPVLATHEGFRHFNDIPRTLLDETYRKLAAKGGVIGFHIGNEFHNRPQYDHRLKLAGKPFYDRSDAIAFKELSLAEIDKHVAANLSLEGVPTPKELLMSVDEWFRVVDYAIGLVGEDHIALGTDFDGGPTLPTPMRDTRDYPLLTQAMVKRGYSEARIKKFLGGNVRRVWERVAQR
jgi:membrane dipeptidase